MRVLALIALFAGLAGAARAADIHVENPQVRASLGGASTAAAYMTLRNLGRTANALVGASCACVGAVMAHETTTTNGISRMRMAGAVALPPGGAAAFEPGGRLHLMLMDLKRPIRAGETVPITLQFRSGPPVTVAFKAVASPTAGPAMPPMRGMHHPEP